MIFASYLLLVVLVLVKPIEAFAPDLAEYRIAMIMSLLVLGMSVFNAFQSGEMAVRSRAFVLLGCFMGAIALSMAVQGWMGGISEALIEFVPSVVFFVTTALIVTNMERLKITCGFIVLCMVLLGIASTMAYHEGFMVDQLVMRESTGKDVSELIDAIPVDVIPAQDTSGTTLWRIRSWGFFSDPNDFSQAIVMSLPMLLGAWMQRRKLRNLIRIWVPCAILLYTAYLTHSRGASLGFGAILLFGLMRKTGPVKATLVLLTMAFGAVVIGFTGGRSFSSSDESAGGRIAAWSEGLDMLGSHPLFGVGYGNFVNHFEYTAHNSFVLCFAETGLFGYFFWIALLVLAFKELSRAISISLPGTDEHRWSILIRLSLMGFMTCALFLSRSYQPILFMLLALCFAASYCAEKAAIVEFEAEQEVLPGPPTWVLATLTTMFISIMVLYAIVRYQNAFVN